MSMEDGKAMVAGLILIPCILGGIVASNFKLLIVSSVAMLLFSIPDKRTRDIRRGMRRTAKLARRANK